MPQITVATIVATISPAHHCYPPAPSPLTLPTTTNHRRKPPTLLAPPQTTDDYENVIAPEDANHPLMLDKSQYNSCTTFASRYPPTNNQLRTSSNPRNQVTIQDGKVTVQNVQGRQTQGYAGSVARGNATSIWVNKNMRTNITNQAKAQVARVILDEEQLAFLTDNGEIFATGPETQYLITTAIFQTDDLDAFNSDYDEAPLASAFLMAKPSAYDSDVLSEVLQKKLLTHIRRAFEKDVILFVKTLREYFQMFDQGLAKEITDMKEVCDQMETDVETCSVKRKYFEIEKKEMFIENDRLLEHIICQDVMCIAMHANLETKCALPANDNNLE
nr:hypothetical protein [Tanacetum cinerariifolium]